MVHIKEVELSNFKSFGGTTRIPLMPEFTVVSGPNGSGKSNILDALLFCLGIASSKGMRAERLPDLVNHDRANRKSTVETSVTVTFDLGSQFPSNGKTAEPDEENDPSREWRVTRRLRVTKTGSYTSNYYLNGEATTLTELHEKLNELRIYPEGYNVVLQGDVTSIISMNSRERREIIDELAGVASFDRKISQAKEKLDAVKEREEQCRIIEKELTSQRDRLAEDKIKAEKYQALRSQLHQKQQWEIVLKWQQFRQQESKLREQIEEGDRTRTQLQEQFANLTQQIDRSSAELEELNAKVKALGEEELIAEQTRLAKQEAQQQQLQQRCAELETSAAQLNSSISQNEQNVKRSQQELDRLRQQQQSLENETIAALRQARDDAQTALEHSREAASSIASAAESWVQEQTQLRHQLETLLGTLDPQRSQQAQLQERVSQLAAKLTEQEKSIGDWERELTAKKAQSEQLNAAQTYAGEKVSSLQSLATEAERELQVQQQTQTRLLQEQREKQRRLDKLEAQAQAQREASGSYATQIISQSDLDGVCGLVAQLGRVEAEFQMALSTAAGARLGYLVVEDDIVASAGIRLLKERKAGRATFLPLNKIRPPRVSIPREVENAAGFIDYAVDLIDCDPQYDDIFAYVFGGTVVFDNLENARRVLGKARIVTLDGELLETSGAMTGGTLRGNASQLHFGNADPQESAEIKGLQDRLNEIEAILKRCEETISHWAHQVKQHSQQLMDAQQGFREKQLETEQLQKQIATLQQQIQQGWEQRQIQTQERATAQTRLETLETEIPQQEVQVQQLREQLAELEKNQTHSEWQIAQSAIREREATLHEREQELRTAAQQLQDRVANSLRLEEMIRESLRRIEEERSQHETKTVQLAAVKSQQLGVEQQIQQIQARLAQLNEKLGEEKQNRDRAETALREQRVAGQQLEWRVQKLQETQQERRERLDYFQEQLATQKTELPDPLPEVPENIKLEELEKEVKSIAKRVQAMEPVNMLALEEYDKTQARLEQLTEKLATLESERTEVLLRIENFTTLRLQAFKEAFDAVNENFSTIFAELSQGDGYLQLGDEEDPFNSGLNLVAHPKGKPVQRLASMSGGEKSLTALSFIFALQRYRPSPFYAFDEVDMFLDGANVERLSKMIAHQALQAQFIVVSLRRPMIESAKRTIGVTQARGAYTQVLGLKLQHQE
ncbi:MAG: chromosome segregation protein SMC, partial [Geitlerinemataceae cyanobacterium]